ncbi:uncharacterized protein LOC128740891 [Sabethes cyaneus]|uniref:uncharacterized protein LOC128740891 n=1 Tax=Sabethes cyaneus TaxID=53552 RepID=UPI00237E523E|nr:uncharacterized protein LOC128740891 [Sabethes cyaneus]
MVTAILLAHLVRGQELMIEQEGSGFELPQNATPSLVYDYVNCPPADGENPERSMMGEAEDVDYSYDYYDILGASNKSEINDSGENVTIDDEQLQGELEAIISQNSTVEEENDASGDGDLILGTFKLIKSPNIYSLPDSELPEVRFSAFTEEHPEEVILTSENYPQPYPKVVNSYENFTVTGGIGVQVTIHNLDLDHESDFLYIRGGSTNDKDEKGPVLTGTIKEPIQFLIAHTTTFSVHFVSQHAETEEQTHAGYRLTYAPFGTVVSPTTPSTTEMIVPRDELQWLRKEISISRTMMASVETWPLIKNALVNASNAFIEQRQLKYQFARVEDIRILAQKCPDTWPNYEECVSLEFAIPLRPLVAVLEEDSEGFGLDGKAKIRGRGFISLTTTEEPVQEYQLTVDNLEQMWTDFGAMALAEVGVEVYQMPENESVLLIWIAISLCVLAAFIFVLYSIWKIDFFKDYRRISRLSREPQDDDRNELKKKEFDISMFPSPHQIVPSLFPTGDPYGEQNPQYAYDNSTMNPWQEETHEGQFNAFEKNPPPPMKRMQQPQAFEPLSPFEYSPGVVDFNEIPESRSPRRSRINPFLPHDNQLDSRP